MASMDFRVDHVHVKCNLILNIVYQDVGETCATLEFCMPQPVEQNAVIVPLFSHVPLMVPKDEKKV